MRVGFYNHTSVVSGAEISLLLTAGNLKEAQPVVIAPEGELGERARTLGLEFHAVAGYRARLTNHPVRLAGHLLGMTAEGLKLARLIRRSEIDIVHANSIRAGIIVSLFAWLHRRPVIWHVRDIPPSGWTGAAVRWFAKRSARSLVCISEAVKSSLGDGWGGRVQVVHNGTELKSFTAAEKASRRAALREEFQVPPEARVVAVVGQIAPWKRQEDALEAVRLLLHNGHDVRLWIVGEPKFREENASYYQRLRQIAAADQTLRDRVVFTGFRGDVLEICGAADLLLLCSDNEPFGRVLIEAMSQETPVVAANGGGVPEIVEHAVSGMLYTAGDTAGLARNAGMLLQNDELRSKMGRAAFERVRACFGIERTVEKLERLYRGLLPPAPLKAAIVHDYLNQMGGAERVVAVLHRMFPEAPIFTTIVQPSVLTEELKRADIRATWMQRIPGILKMFKSYFWLYPFAVRSIRLRGYDLVISSSSAYAKGIRVSPGTVHVCYCHTPMRFAWDFEGYMNHLEIPGLIKRIARFFTPALRRWDVRNSKGVDQFVANSGVVRERILRHYRRNASLVYPPVQLSRFRFPVDAEPDAGGGYFLVVSRLVSYKRIDLAVQACTMLNRRLFVVGDGPDRVRLEKMAGPPVSFTGRIADEQVGRLMRGCEALLFPGAEDFGITPLEANACGRPVVAFREGGALDTIVHGLNGIFFDRQTPESLTEAMERLQQYAWDPQAIRSHAESFREERFESELLTIIETALQAKGKGKRNMARSKEVTA